MILTTGIETALGLMIAGAVEEGICLLEFSYRAIASANGMNRIAIIIPCHRVIGSDGSLTGYGGGLKRKRWLLDHEKKYSGKPVDLSLFG